MSFGNTLLRSLGQLYEKISAKSQPPKILNFSFTVHQNLQSFKKQGGTRTLGSWLTCFNFYSIDIYIYNLYSTLHFTSKFAFQGKISYYSWNHPVHGRGYDFIRIFIVSNEMQVKLIPNGQKIRENIPCSRLLLDFHGFYIFKDLIKCQINKLPVRLPILMVKNCEKSRGQNFSQTYMISLLMKMTNKVNTR